MPVKLDGSAEVCGEGPFRIGADEGNGAARGGIALAQMGIDAGVHHVVMENFSHFVGPDLADKAGFHPEISKPMDGICRRTA